MRMPVWRMTRRALAGGIIAAQEFLLDEPILFGGQRAREPSIALRNVIGVEKTDQGGQIMEPGEFLHQTTQGDDMQGASAFHQRRFLRGEPIQPAQNVRVPPQLFEGSDARMMLPQIAEKVLRGGAVAAFGRDRSSKWLPIRSRVKNTSAKWMIEWQAASRLMSGTAERPHQLSHGADILLIDILRRDADVDHGGLDLRVSHQLHERGQADAGADHVRGEGVPESMRIGFGDAGGLAMMAEQRAQSGGGHARSTCAPFQANEQSRAAVRRTFQTQIVIE